MSVHQLRDGSGRAGLPVRSPFGRAVDRPVFWWSAAGIFVVNAWISAGEDRWVLAVLQALTCVWAVVAGVTAHFAAPPAPSGGDQSNRDP